MASAPVGTTRAAPAVVDTGGPALVFRAVDADRTRRNRDADRLEARHPDFAMAKRLERRHRIRGSRRAPALLRLGVAGNADLARDAIVIGGNVGVGDRPIQPAAVLALHVEVGRQQAGKIGGVVQRRAARAPAMIGGATDGVTALIDDGWTTAAQASSPDVGADEVGELPVRPLFEHHHVLAGAGEHRCEHRSRRSRSDNDGVRLLACRHVTSSAREGYGACRARLAAQSPPRCRRPHRSHHCEASRTRRTATVPASPRSCSGADG